jgi:polysaccharide pyruvyl transferase WcaK-like protein
LFFSNGANEDQSYLRSVFTDPGLSKAAAAGRVRAAERPTVPESLLRLLQSFDAVVAHRLHASIASYALGRPHVGLAWDRKVESFYRSVGRERFMVSGANPNPTGTADLIVEAYRQGLDEQQRASVIADANRAVKRMLVHRELNSTLIPDPQIRRPVWRRMYS